MLNQSSILEVIRVQPMQQRESLPRPLSQHVKQREEVHAKMRNVLPLLLDEINLGFTVGRTMPNFLRRL